MRQRTFRRRKKLSKCNISEWQGKIYATDDIRNNRDKNSREYVKLSDILCNNRNRRRARAARLTVTASGRCLYDNDYDRQ